MATASTQSASMHPDPGALAKASSGVNVTNGPTGEGASSHSPGLTSTGTPVPRDSHAFRASAHGAADGIDSTGGFDGVEATPGLPVQFARLPVGLMVAVPVREFRVRNLLAIATGDVIETQWGHGEDLPLSSADVQLAWSEFEVVDAGLAVRVTRLA